MMRGFLPPLGSVRMRLTLWNVAVLAFVLIVLGAVFRYRLWADSIAAIDHHLSDVAHEFQNRLPSGDPPFPSRQHPAPKKTPAVADTDNNSPRRYRPHAFDVQGHSLFVGNTDTPLDISGGFRQAVQGQTLYTDAEQDGDPLRVFSMPLLRKGQAIGVIQFAASLTPLHAAVNQMTRTLLTLIPLALLIAGFGGAFLTDRALRPVRQITQSAGKIEAANLSGRLPVVGRDEFSLLSATFNAMLGRLETAFGRLEQAFQQQRRFTADASHELRTPLTIIKANTSLALSGPRTSEQYRQALVAADTAADRMNRIVQDLLLIARSDAAQWEPQLSPTPLAEALDQAIEPLRSPAHPTIVLNQPDDPLFVQGDAHSLVRLFANLLENAVRHTPPDGRITVSAEEDAAHVTIIIADTGEGIAPEHLPHVTERFYRVDEARARADGGSGLGLAICTSIVQAHGGTLALQSAVGQGTTVRVTLLRAENPSIVAVSDEAFTFSS